ncbi:MAG: NAD(P)/FAD-dependent oxidoreductase [Oscillospiraceae bacterium]|nr:NAD(P)/FAD-dependent oxidoreductase [Oscillospiraceae bacterium]
MYDIVIIGTGPAGISAAITAKVRNKDIILLGSDVLSDKMRKAHTVLNYPGLPDISGEGLADAYKKHLDSLDIKITADIATAVYDMGGSFSVQGRSGMMYEARSVIFATGTATAKGIPGEEENLGMGVSYCATCDAPLYKGKTAAVIAYSADEEREAAFLAELADTVLYFPMYKGDVSFEAKNIRVIYEKPVEIADRGRRLVTDSAEHSIDGVFVLRESVAPKNMMSGLETDGAHIVTDREMNTSISGVFACGDIAGRPYQLVKAAGEGNIAALSCVKYLDEIKK